MMTKMKRQFAVGSGCVEVRVREAESLGEDSEMDISTPNGCFTITGSRDIVSLVKIMESVKVLLIEE